MAEESTQKVEPQIREDSMNALSALQFKGGLTPDDANKAVQDVHNLNTGEKPVEEKVEEKKPEAGAVAGEGDAAGANKEGAQGTTAAAPIIPKGEEKKTDANAENFVPEVKTAEGIKSPAYEETVIEHDLVGKQTLGGKKLTEIDMSDPKAIESFITEITGLDSFEKVGPTINSWRREAQLKSDAEKARDDIQGMITNLPPQMQNMIMDFNQGQDWLSNFQAFPSLDYSKNASAYTDKELVDAMFSGKVSSEEWTESKEEDADKNLKDRINDLGERAREKFKQNKSTIETTRAGYLDTATKAQEAYANSIPSSESHFSQTFPEAAPTVLEGIVKEIGDGGVNQLFFKPDGSLCEDALVNYAMAKSGKQLLDKYVAAAQKNAVNEHTEKELADKKGTIRTSGGPGSGGDAKTDDVASNVNKELFNVFGNSQDRGFKY